MEQVNIQIPEGYVIDQEESNLEEGKIVFKKKEATPWRYNNPEVKGFYVTSVNSTISELSCPSLWDGNENVFANKKQAESMLAMAQLSQIIQNDKRFGGPITDEEWNNRKTSKYCIMRDRNNISGASLISSYHFLAFHTPEQYSLFLKENEDLIRQYFMLD